MTRTLTLTLAALALAGPAAAWDSGSSGADGALHATSDLDVAVPASGRLEYTTITIDPGVTVRFVHDGPVTVLASGDVHVAGVIDVGGRAATAGTGGLVALGGAPGPGGSWGGSATLAGGLVGLGPGGGGGAFRCGAAGGAGPAARGQDGPEGCGASGGVPIAARRTTYLHGGSGGGGTELDGGGGGGGALTLAASGTITVTGEIRADGGPGTGRAGSGGGGHVRLVATALAGSGRVAARGGGACGDAGLGGCGGAGVVRLEGETIARALHAASEPRAAIGRPQAASLANPPRLRISSVDGVAPEALAPGVHPQLRVPLTADAGAEIAIIVTAEEVVPGTIVFASVTVPTRGAARTVTGQAVLDGTKASSSATITMTLPALMTPSANLATIEAWAPDLLAN